jgi:BirA family biotin operon repressor/biotin-[acetyl-CoA-carboxylase] ligase
VDLKAIFYRSEFFYENIPLKNLLPLLDCLLSNEFVSGEYLSKKFNISRTTVSAWVKQLALYGLTIHSVKGKGYRLVEPLQLLEKNKINSSLKHNTAEKISVIDITAEALSTNQLALSSDYLDDRWKLFTTEYQHSGRGRRGRKWVSPFGKNLLFSLGRKAYWDSRTLYGASIIFGISIAKTLQAYTDAPVRIKWPNDVYIYDNKVAGILCELEGNPTDEALLVAGVGLNLYSSPDLSDKETTSLIQHSNIEIDRNHLLSHIASEMISNIGNIESHDELFISQWASVDYLYDKTVEVRKGDSVIRGTALGIDAQGQLKLQMDSGEILIFNGGEVSVRW